MIPVSLLEKKLLLVNLILYGFLAIFSYSYVDLNLTISQNPMVLKFVAFMQQLGYYHRPQATLIYLMWLTSAFSFFILNLYLFYKAKIGFKYLKLSLLTNTIILIFAYPFLSSDLFNYLFDAKIITTYHLSPYSHKPLDFPQDEWLRFMRWVHRYSPYGPLWLGVSIIPSLLGFGKFILNLILFKVFIASFHLINSLIIYKFLKKISPQQALFGTAFYALNPLFLIEGVANSHNDIVLASFLLAAVYFLAKKDMIKTYAILALGVFIKYIPLLIFPWLIIQNLVKVDIRRTILLSLLTMSAFTLMYSSFKITAPFVSSGSTQVQFQPWYLFWTIPYVALLPEISIVIAAISICLGAALRYLPYLYNGDWSQPGTTNFMQLVTIIPFVISIIFILLKKSTK